jgi:hypothetical protein
MEQKRLIRYMALVFLVVLTSISLAGCAMEMSTQYGQWDHAISVDEFSSHPTLACLVYKYDDTRFNDEDYFDMYTVEAAGISDFDSVYDSTLGVFLYQPVYSNGSVTWLAHPGADSLLDGTIMRFYHIWN